jgi:hypothetical protein
VLELAYSAPITAAQRGIGRQGGRHAAITCSAVVDAVAKNAEPVLEPDGEVIVSAISVFAGEHELFGTYKLKKITFKAVDSGQEETIPNVNGFTLIRERGACLSSSREGRGPSLKVFPR